MSFEPGASNRNSYGWNYSNPDKDGYSTKITGTVLGLQNVQAVDYDTKEPAYWKEGNPKMNHRLVLVGANGGVKTFTYQPASKAQQKGEKPSVHMDLTKLYGTMAALIGKTISISTEEPPKGFGYTQKNPRPWKVEDASDQGTFEPADALEETLIAAYVYFDGTCSESPLASQKKFIPKAEPAQGDAPDYEPVPVEVLGEEIPF